jgi:hypothetical protein
MIEWSQEDGQVQYIPVVSSGMNGSIRTQDVRYDKQRNFSPDSSHKLLTPQQLRERERRVRYYTNCITKGEELYGKVPYTYCLRQSIKKNSFCKRIKLKKLTFK